jgi:hypothetical protein
MIVAVSGQCNVIPLPFCDTKSAGYISSQGGKTKSRKHTTGIARYAHPIAACVVCGGRKNYLVVSKTFCVYPRLKRSLIIKRQSAANV